MAQSHVPGPAATQEADKLEIVTLLRASPGSLDAGTVPQGGHRQIRFDLHNSGDTAVDVTEISTSCGCFEVVISDRQIVPGATVGAVARIDLADKPGFVGSLQLEATGRSGTNKTAAFIVRVHVDVEEIIR